MSSAWVCIQYISYGSYDECNRLERVRITAAESSGLQNSGSSITEYTRDVYGRITAIEDENGTTVYTYDDLAESVV